VLVSTLPIKHGYTTVEMKIPKDDDKRSLSAQSSEELGVLDA
jgi:hypothetical protein